MPKTLGITGDVHFIRTRGWPVYESATVGGPQGHFCLKGRHVTPEEAQQFAQTLRDRRALAHAASTTASTAAAVASTIREPVMEKPANPPKDILRGLSEDQVRDDLRRVFQHLGNAKATCQKLNISPSHYYAVNGGHQAPGMAMMQALYGPTGTTIRPGLLKGTPAGGAAGIDETNEGQQPESAVKVTRRLFTGTATEKPSAALPSADVQAAWSMLDLTAPAHLEWLLHHASATERRLRAAWVACQHQLDEASEQLGEASEQLDEASEQLRAIVRINFRLRSILRQPPATAADPS